MENFNIEIKAKCSFQEDIRKILKESKATFAGEDHQIDTYFNVSNGRLKLREGNIENTLIHYDREDKEEPKLSDYLLYKTKPGELLKELLTKALGVLTIIDKEREIYLLDNVKIHLDTVKELGTFIEIEVIGKKENEKDKLLNKCKYYLKLFRIKDEDLIPFSYSDMKLNLN
jgi:adenylate cyclase, class 2